MRTHNEHRSIALPPTAAHFKNDHVWGVDADKILNQQIVLILVSKIGLSIGCRPDEIRKRDGLWIPAQAKTAALATIPKM